jgi:hypothetical protein
MPVRVGPGITLAGDWPGKGSIIARWNLERRLVETLLNLTVTVENGYGFLVEGNSIVTASSLLKPAGPHLIAPLGCKPSIPAKAHFYGETAVLTGVDELIDTLLADKRKTPRQPLKPVDNIDEIEGTAFILEWNAKRAKVANGPLPVIKQYENSGWYVRRIGLVRRPGLWLCQVTRKAGKPTHVNVQGRFDKALIGSPIVNIEGKVVAVCVKSRGLQPRLGYTLQLYHNHR